jgi:predicted O-methyltransferase YrrM
MKITNPQAEEYAAAHTTAESDVLKKLNRETHAKILKPRMLSGHLQGSFLQVISLIKQPKRILEIGTYTGYSAICLSHGLCADGEIHTIDINPEIENFTNRFFEQAGIKNKIHFHIGDALTVIPELPGEFDIIFIDGEKKHYPDYLNVALPKLAQGGLLIADNVMWDGKVFSDEPSGDADENGIREFNRMILQHEELFQVMLPLRDGLLMAVKQ